jgi:tRNA1(Val) A37 N6-methylase TrmN6
MREHIGSAITEDRFLNGRMRLRQPARGYRAGADAILLAAAVEAAPGARLLEAGCGAGAALVAAATFSPGASFLGVERDPQAAALARENVALNGLGDRVEIVEEDALSIGGAYDGIFLNPPFFDEDGAGQPPAPSRRSSFLSEAAIEDWIKTLANRLRGGAALTLIHRAERLGDILGALKGRLGGVAVFPVRPVESAPAKRVLVRAVKGSRAPTSLLKGLDLHDRSGAKHTAQAEAILRGEARIDWRGPSAAT